MRSPQQGSPGGGQSVHRLNGSPARAAPETEKPPAGKSRGRLAEVLAIPDRTVRVLAIRLNRRHAPEGSLSTESRPAGGGSAAPRPGGKDRDFAPGFLPAAWADDLFFRRPLDSFRRLAAVAAAVLENRHRILPSEIFIFLYHCRAGCKPRQQRHSAFPPHRQIPFISCASMV